MTQVQPPQGPHQAFQAAAEQAMAAHAAQQQQPGAGAGPGPMQQPDPDQAEDAQVKVAIAHIAAQLGLITHLLMTKGVITPQDLGGAQQGGAGGPAAGGPMPNAGPTQQMMPPSR